MGRIRMQQWLAYAAVLRGTRLACPGDGWHLPMSVSFDANISFYISRTFSKAACTVEAWSFCAFSGIRSTEFGNLGELLRWTATSLWSINKNEGMNFKCINSFGFEMLYPWVRMKTNTKGTLSGQKPVKHIYFAHYLSRSVVFCCKSQYLWDLAQCLLLRPWPVPLSWERFRKDNSLSDLPISSSDFNSLVFFHFDLKRIPVPILFF